MADQLPREIDSVVLNKQISFNKKSSICLIEFEAWWKAIGVQKLGKTIEQHVTSFGHLTMHVVSHIL